MNSYIRPIGAAGCCGWFNLKTLAVAFGAFVVSGFVCSAAFTDNFQFDTVGAPPSGWTLSGTNGTTATENVAAEGANNFLALRNTSGSTAIGASRSDVVTGTSETSGFLQFDIRFNQGIAGADLQMILFASKAGYCSSCLQPIQLDFFHGAYNTNNPLLFTSRGNNGYPPADPNAGAAITNNFPIGSWQTIRVDFYSNGPDPSQPRGTYTVSWNGITNSYYYLNQGDLFSNPNSIALDKLYIATDTAPTSESVDIDNIQFIPEPSAAMLLMAGGLLLWRRRGGR